MKKTAIKILKIEVKDENYDTLVKMINFVNIISMDLLSLSKSKVSMKKIIITYLIVVHIQIVGGRENGYKTRKPGGLAFSVHSVPKQGKQKNISITFKKNK